MNQTLTNEITAKQLSFLTRLLDEATELLDSRDQITGCEWPEARQAVAQMRTGADMMTRREASAAIDQAMDNNRKLREELKGLGVQSEPTLSEPQYVTETGMYRVGERIFKVLPSRSSDRHYAKELTGFHWEDKLPFADSESGDFKFTYAPGAMRLIRAEHRMSDEMARAFGQLTGHCCVCGKLLTDPKSIEAGIGPVCSGKR